MAQSQSVPPRIWSDAGVFRVLIVDNAQSTGARVAQLCLRHHVRLRGIPASVIDVASAGLDAVEGEPLPAEVQRHLQRHGIEDEGLLSHRLLVRHVMRADLIITGSRGAQEALIAAFPQAEPKAFRMTELAELYGMVVGIAPLKEHAPMLLHARRATTVASHYDLEPHDGVSEGLDKFIDDIDRASAWLAGVWASMAPASREPRPAIVPDGEQVVVPLTVLGLPAVVRCTGSSRAELADEVRDIWSWCLRDDGAAPVIDIEAVAEADAEVLAPAQARGALAYPTVDSVMHFLSSTVTVRAIEARAGELFMLRASAVALADGSVLGFLGPAGMGKTTLARLFGRHISYVTDEILAVAPDGTVLPYPKPLALVTDDGWVLKEQWGPDALGLIRPPLALRFTHLYLLWRLPEEKDRAVVEPLDLDEAMELVLPHVSSLGAMEDGEARLRELLESVGVSRLRYRQALSVLPMLRQFDAEARSRM